MSYRPVLSTTIEALGASFTFVAASNAEGRLVSFIQRYAAEHGAAEFEDVSALPVEVVEIMADLFVQGCKAWEGVEQEDKDGNVIKLPCTIPNKEAIPTDDKLLIVTAYMDYKKALEEKKGSGESSLTEFTDEVEK